MPKFSILIPVYNTEKQLNICLDSVLGQTYKDFEIIVVNDGSTDNSNKIIEEYLNKYKDKIKYYYKNNTGIADTRNYAINKASGEYIIFIDSDDYIDKNLLEKLRTYTVNNTDMVKFKLTKVDKNLKNPEKVDGPVFDKITGEEAFNILFSTDVLMDSPCLYAVRKKYIEENNFKFTYGMEHEDFGLIPLMIVKAKTFISTDIYGYFYIQSDNSIMRNENHDRLLKKIGDSFKHYDNMLQNVKTYPIKKKTYENIRIFYTNSILMKIKQLNGDDRKKYIKEFKIRNMNRNIKIRNIKQFIKRIILTINVDLYLNMQK